MTQSEFCDAFRQKLVALAGVGIVAQDPQYKSLWQNLFQQGAEAGLVLRAQELFDLLYAQDAASMDDPAVLRVYDNMQSFWDRWVEEARSR